MSRPWRAAVTTRRDALACALGAALGCAPEPLRLPDSAAAAVAMIAEGRPRTVTLAPYDPQQAALAIPAAQPDATLYVLTFSEPLEALGLVSGTFLDASADLWSVPLPPPVAAFEGGWSGDGWRPIDPALLAPFMLPVESPTACAERGGCFADARATQCTVPCPPPPAIAAPEPPRALQYRPCPAGWTDDAAAQACRPWASTPAPCAAGRLHLPGEGLCRAPGTTCTETWPAELSDATTTFVRAGALGGTGARASPLGTIEAALAQDRPVIALAPGSYAAPARVVGARRVVGACATETWLEAGGPIVIGGGVELEALSVRAARVRVEGSAGVRGVYVDAPIEVTGAGALATVEAVLDGGSSDAVTLPAEGQLHVRSSRLTSRAVSVSATRTASITVIGSVLEGGVSALTSTSARITVRESVAASGSGPTLAVHFTELDADAVVLLAPAGVALLTTGGSDVRVRRAVFGGAQGGARIELGGQARIEDSRFEDVVDWPNMVQARNALLELRRTSMGNGYDRAVATEGSGITLVLEDLDVPQARARALDIDGSSIRIARVRLTEHSLISLSEARGAAPVPAVLEDVLLYRAALAIRGEGLTRISRLEAVEPQGFGLGFRPGPQPPTVVAVDIRITGTRPEAICGNDYFCSGAALYIEDGDLEIERFHIADSGGPAFSLQSTTNRLRASHGVIEGQSVGFALRQVGRVRLREMMHSVHLREVARICDPCGR